MQTKKAIALANFIDEAYKIFGEVFKVNVLDEVELDEYKLKYNKSTFELYYNEFENELKNNIDEYQKINPIQSYVVCHFEKFYQWCPFDSDYDLNIIKQGYEVSFLIKLKMCIEKYAEKTSNMCFVGSYSDPLSSIFHKRISLLKSAKEKNTEELIPQIRFENKPSIDDRFDFGKIKTKSDQLSSTIDKIKFIHERLFDLEQWEIQYDEQIDDPDIGIYYKLSNQYYPNFKELCKSELKRLDKLSDLEKKTTLKESTPVIIQNINPSSFGWNSTDTALLELVTALFQLNAIKRKDGNKLKRNELIAYFERMFGFQIKDAEGKLTKATGRNDKTPFLNKLKVAFEKYVEEKEEKLQKRR